MSGPVSVADDVATQRQKMIAILHHEMRTNAAFVRVHAAEALIAQGESASVAAFFEPEQATAEPPYRIGVWRVLAKSASTEALRDGYAERIRQAMLDPKGPDRLHASESLGKIGKANPEDRAAIEQWIRDLDDANAAFPRWVLVLSGSPAQRTSDEAKLVALLDSKDPIARLRAGFAIGRLKDAAEPSIAKLRERVAVEPEDSPARAYLLEAAILHTPHDVPEHDALKKKLAAYLVKGKPNEQMEAAGAIGLCGTSDDLPALAPLLTAPQPDARIGGALGSLYLLK